jgi:multidrug resistance efflux pump
VSNTFSHSLRSLERDSFHRSLWSLFLAVSLLGVLGAWLGLARVAVYEVTDSARVELKSYPVEAAVASPHTVSASYLTLGRVVQTGDILVKLAAASEEAELDGEQTRLTLQSQQLERFQQTLIQGQAAFSATQATAQAVFDEANIQYQNAEAAAQAAEDQSAAGAQALRGRADTLHFALLQLQAQQQAQANSTLIRLEALNHLALGMELNIAETQENINSLRAFLNEHTLRAPVAGQLGEIIDLQPGSVVSGGQQLAVIIPFQAELRIVAYFPVTALGRIQIGQPAHLRLNGFPWTQYGNISATVINVAQEAKDGQLRVELTILPDPDSPIPLQHGLAGTAAVEVERLSPAALVLRAAGLWRTPRPANS